MFPKACTFYQLDATDHDLTRLSDGLARRPFHACTGLEWSSSGWVPPAPQQEVLAYPAKGVYQVSIKQQTKVLPGAVVREHLDAKVSEIEDKEQRKLGRKEKQALKEQITDDLLPRAFTKSSCTQAALDAEAGLLWVYSTSRTNAETLISELREALPGLPARLPQTVLSPASAMTGWMADGQVGGGFELDDEALLRAPGENGGKIKISRLDLTSDEIRQHLHGGKQVIEIGLIWNERVSFVLGEDLSLKKMKWLDVLQEEASQAGDDAAALYEATTLIVGQELRSLVGALVAELGGYAAQAASDSPSSQDSSQHEKVAA